MDIFIANYFQPQQLTWVILREERRYLPVHMCQHAAVLVTDGNFEPKMWSPGKSCRTIFLRIFFISSLFSIVEYFNFSRPPSFDGATAEVGGTIMVTCVPVCCNKLIGPSWLLLLMITNNTATVVNQGAVDALINTLKSIFFG